MGKKTVTFEFMKDRVIKVIDSLSKYGVCVSAKVNYAGNDIATTTITTYTATIFCKPRDLSACLGDIMALNRDGVTIDKLFVR